MPADAQGPSPTDLPLIEPHRQVSVTPSPANPSDRVAIFVPASADVEKTKDRGSLNKVLIAVATALVTVPATFFINDYLSRDHITIESVEIRPLMTSFMLKEEQL